MSDLVTPTLECGVPDARGRLGVVLRAPVAESLTWDLESEIASTGRHRLLEPGTWWIALSYFDSAVDIVLRSFGSVLVLDRVHGDRLYSRDGHVGVQERLL